MSERDERISETRELLAAGDFKLEEYRGHYLVCFGHPTLLTDDEIVEVIADAEDDYDPEGWAKLMKQKEDSRPTSERKSA